MNLKTCLAIYLGYEYFTYHGASLGLAYARYAEVGGWKYGRGVSVSGAAIFDTTIAFGPQLSAWMCGGAYHVGFGGTAGYYINERGQATFRVCPQLGAGGKRWRIFYGYSFSLLGTTMLTQYSSTVCLHWLFDVHTFKRNNLGTDKNLKRN